MSIDATRELVRAVTREVVQRLGSASPEVIEAVVSEVLAATKATGAATGTVAASARSATESGTFRTPRGAELRVIGNDGPTLDHCLACVDQERRRETSRAVLTTTGRNTRGVVARVTARIAEAGGDILDISQTIVGDFFTMIIVVDVSQLGVDFARFKDDVESTIRDLGCQAMLMHEDVMTALHRV